MHSYYCKSNRWFLSIIYDGDLKISGKIIQKMQKNFIYTLYSKDVNKILVYFIIYFVYLLLLEDNLLPRLIELYFNFIYVYILY
jgi:hypothetical protein